MLRPFAASRVRCTFYLSLRFEVLAWDAWSKLIQNIALPYCWVWWTLSLNPNSCSRVCSCTPPKLIWQPRRTFWCRVWRLVHLLKFVKVSRRSHGHVLAVPNRSRELFEDDNLSIFGRIIRELSLQSERSRRGLQGRGQEDGGFLDFLMVCSAKNYHSYGFPFRKWSTKAGFARSIVCLLGKWRTLGLVLGWRVDFGIWGCFLYSHLAEYMLLMLAA